MRLSILLAAVVVWFGLAGFAAAERRIALVIGNSAYERTGWALANPVRDARLIEASLARVGFEVETVLDGDFETMTAAIARFGQRLAGAGPDAVGLFYFAGHGVQSQGLNYLLPIDARAQSEQDVWSQGVRLGLATQYMEAAGNRVNLIVIDACRDNPLPRANRSAGAGLAAAPRASGMLVAYATAPGFVAADGAGANSPFSAALAAEIARPGLPAELMLKRVADRVRAETGGVQQPWYESGLSGADFCFGGCDTATVGVGVADAEQVLWDVALAQNTQAAFETYLASHPQGRFAAAARARIAGLSAAAPAQTRSTGEPAATGSVWDALQSHQDSLPGQGPSAHPLAAPALTALRRQRVRSIDPALDRADPADFVFFAANDRRIAAEEQARMPALAARLQAVLARSPQLRVQIAGSCDAAETSLAVCTGRAASVRDALIGAGVPATRVANSIMMDRGRLISPPVGVDSAAVNRYAWVRLIE